MLLADEPTGQLDSVTGERMVELLRQLNADGQAIVVVTHNPEVAARAATIYRMKDGRLRRVTAEAYEQLTPSVPVAAEGVSASGGTPRQTSVSDATRKGEAESRFIRVGARRHIAPSGHCGVLHT